VSFLVTLSPFSIVAFAQPQNQEQLNTMGQTFMQIALQSRERAYELRAFILGKIGNIPEEVDPLLNEADTLMAEDDISNAIEAMNKYRNAYRYLHRYLEQYGVDTETPQKVRGIIIAINKTYTRIEHLNNTLNVVDNKLDDTDPEYEQIKTYLEWAWGNLTEAADNLYLANQSMYLDPPNLILATLNLTEANKNIQEAHAALKPIASWTNQWRIRSFLGEQERFRQRIRERIQQGGFNLNAVLEKLGYTSKEDFHQEIDQLMENAQQKMEIREAIQKLWQIMTKLREMDNCINEEL